MQSNMVKKMVFGYLKYRPIITPSVAETKQPIQKIQLPDETINGNISHKSIPARIIRFSLLLNEKRKKTPIKVAITNCSSNLVNICTFPPLKKLRKSIEKNETNCNCINLNTLRPLICVIAK